MTGRILQNSNVIEVRQGDSFTITLNIKRDCKDVDLTGSKLNMQVRKMDDNQLMFDLLGTEIDIQAGRIALILTPAQTGIDVGDYKTDIQLTTSDGMVNTIFPADVNRIGIFRVTEQVTND